MYAAHIWRRLFFINGNNWKIMSARNYMQWGTSTVFGGISKKKFSDG